MQIWLGALQTFVESGSLVLPGMGWLRWVDDQAGHISEAKVARMQMCPRTQRSIVQSQRPHTVNLISGNRFSLDLRKTSAWDYQRRPPRPWPTVTAASHLGHDYVARWAAITVKQKNAAHITPEAVAHIQWNHQPTSTEIRKEPRIPRISFLKRTSSDDFRETPTSFFGRLRKTSLSL